MKKKKYRLLKDLLVSRKGDIFVWSDEHGAYGNQNSNICLYNWSEKQISSDSDFEEVLEEEPPQLFTKNEIKQIMEMNFEKSMDLVAFYHNLLISFGIKLI